MSDHLERLERRATSGGSGNVGEYGTWTAFYSDVRTACEEVRHLRQQVESLKALEQMFADLPHDDDGGYYEMGVKHGAARERTKIVDYVRKRMRTFGEGHYEWLAGEILSQKPIRAPLPAERLEKLLRVVLDSVSTESSEDHHTSAKVIVWGSRQDELLQALQEAEMLLGRFEELPNG